MGRVMGSRPALFRLVVATLAAILLGAAGFVAGRGVRNYRSSVRQPGSNPTVTAQVEQGSLRDVVIGSAVVQPGRTITVGVPILSAEVRPIVTAVFRRPGDAVRAGDVLAAVANRPVIALPGEVPAFRTMRRRLAGTDISQLQLGLAGLGLGIGGDPLGFYGIGTAHAVAAMYRDRGFTPTDADSVGLNTSDAAEAAVPVGEVVFVDVLPGRVLDLSVDVGNTVETSLMTLADGSRRLVGTIPDVDVPRVHRGNRAEVRFEDGRTLRAVVAQVVTEGGDEAAPDTQTADPTVPAEEGQARLLLRTSAPIPARRLGQSAQLEVVVRRSAPTSLVVPITAVFASADGQTWLEVVNATSRRRVTVTVGLVAGGRAVVTAPDGSLEEGDELLVAESGTLYGTISSSGF